MNKERRPGLDKLAKDLKRENPHWTLAQCLAEAKARWTNKPSKG